MRNTKTFNIFKRYRLINPHIRTAVRLLQSQMKNSANRAFQDMFIRYNTRYISAITYAKMIYISTTIRLVTMIIEA